MILYVKSDIEPVFKNYLWFESNEDSAKPFSFRGIEKITDMFNETRTEEEKIKFKFVNNKNGLLIDFCDSLAGYNEYVLYLGNEPYCFFTFKAKYFNVKKMLEHDCDYFVCRFALDNKFLRYHPKGFLDSFSTPIFLGVVDLINDSFLATPIKTNLSKNKKLRYFFSLLKNENRREDTLYLTCAAKNKSDFIEVDFSKPVLFSYIGISVSIVSEFSNKRNKIKTLK